MVGSILVVAAAKESKSWPSVTGTIVSSEVTERPAGGKGGGIAYVPEVRYRYTVGGTSYEGAHIWLSGDNQGEDRVRKMVAQFPAGSLLPVFYKPSLPSQAVLKTGTNQFMYFDIGVPLAVFLVGVVICPGWKFLRRIGSLPNKALQPTAGAGGGPG